MRVLIVEDETPLAQALVEILKKNAIAADAVFDGETGLDYAETGLYDAVILDIMLPRMSGIEVLRLLRKKGVPTPVLLLTAKDDVSDKVAGLDGGADDYLTKPFFTEELMARIRAISRRKDKPPEEALQNFGLVLSQKTYELSSRTSSVKLGLKEFQIMELLMRNPRQVLTKEQLIQKVWGLDADAEYNNVEVYISFLRKKLAFLVAEASIKTARGIGYSLEGSHD